jgi:hypothetical protein
MLNTIIAQHGVSATPFWEKPDEDFLQFLHWYMKVKEMPEDVEPWNYMNAMQKAWAQWFMRDLGLGEWLDARPYNALTAEYCDLWFLYNYIKQIKPERVLEIGSGCSTAVMARAMDENNLGTLYSVDESEAWASSTMTALPSARVVMSTSPVVKRSGIAYYEELPIVDPQFIYIDGPNLKKYEFKSQPGEVDYQEIRLSVDMLRLEPSLTPGCAVLFDQRTASMEVLLKKGRRNWLMLERKIWRNWFGVLIS